MMHLEVIGERMTEMLGYTCKLWLVFNVCITFVWYRESKKKEATKIIILCIICLNQLWYSHMNAHQILLVNYAQNATNED